MYNRRKFVKEISAGALLAGLPDVLFSQKNPGTDKIWACLLHLSFNMWEEYVSPHRPFRGYQPFLNISESLWKDALLKMSNQGINTVVIDLGNAVKYKSHPEIAVTDAWSTRRLTEELDHMRKLGLEPIPKLNFSAGHDTWLGKFSRRLFHLGMDEESAIHQSYYHYVVVRQNEAWWNDFYFLVEEVEKHRSRAWIWSDYMLWNHPEQFFTKMPKSVVQSNWYYGEDFGNEKDQKVVKAYLDLETHGYDQIPTGSFHDQNEKSIIRTVEFCNKKIDDQRLLGFLQTFWKPTLEEYRERILRGIELAGDAKEWFSKAVF